MRCQLLAQRGFVVVKCDNRGSFRRGLAFEGAIKGNMGDVEVLDQVAAVRFLARQQAFGIGKSPFEGAGTGVGSSLTSHSQGRLLDPARVGIFGWSYGGYMSAMSLCRQPYTADCGGYAGGYPFKCAVSGAPVTSWDGYDTHYTERYMGTPQSNPEGYRRSSVMTHVQSLPKVTENLVILSILSLFSRSVYLS
jgi:dipeptidyl-peptidase-4